MSTERKGKRRERRARLSRSCRGRRTHPHEEIVPGRGCDGVAGPHRALRRQVQRLHCIDAGTGIDRGAGGRGRDSGRATAPAVPWHALCAEGHHRRRGSRDHGAFQDPEGQHRPTARGGYGAARSGWRGAARQALDPRIRHWRPILRPALAAGPQPVEPRSFLRRLVERQRCRPRCRFLPGGARHRHRRLDPQSGFDVRHYRHEADLWQGPPPRRRHARLLPRPYRMSRTVRDNALMLQVIAGHDPGDPGSAAEPVPDYGALLGQDVRGLRIGVIRHFYTKDGAGNPEQVEALDGAVKLLAEAGAEVSEITLPALQDFSACGQIILAAEAYAVHEQWLKERPEDYGARARERLLAGATLRAVDYLQAVRWRLQLRDRVAKDFADIDLAITASSMDPACRIDDDEALAANYWRQAGMPFNVTGQPALVIPAGFNK